MSDAGASATPDPGALRLEVVAGKAAGFTIVVDDRLVIGRHSEGPGRLADDPELSRHHAQISRDPSGTYAIEDLASTNGTLVNGKRLEESAVLANGDSIEVGGTTLVVQSAPAAATPMPAAVDVRAATVIVDTPAAMRSAEPPPPAPAQEPPPPVPAQELAPPTVPAQELEPPPAPAPELEPPTVPAQELAPPTVPAQELEPPTVPAPELEPPTVPAPELEPQTAPEPQTVFAQELEPQTVFAQELEPPPAPLPEPPVPEPLVGTAEQLANEGGPPTEALAAPVAPRIELRLVVDPDRGEAEIRLEDGGEPVRLSVQQGRWQVVDGAP